MGTGSAALALGLSVDKLLRAVHQGTVTPAAVTPGGHRRFAASQLSSNGVGIRARKRQEEGHG